jgi:glycosyltransferase involved in cell wall biosynthesis
MGDAFHDKNRGPSGGAMTRKVGIFRHTLFLPSERFIPDQARALRRSQTLLIARDPIIDDVVELETTSLADISRSAVLRHTLLGDSRPLKTILRSNGVDIVHAHFGVEGLYASNAAAELNLPQVTTLHGFDLTVSDTALLRSGKPAWLRYAAGRRKFFLGDTHFVCVSQHLRDLAVRSGIAEERCSVIGTGVRSEGIEPVTAPSYPVILHVARLVEKKGTEFLLRAFNIVLHKNPDAKLRIVGDGPLRVKLEQLASELCINTSVSFLGSLPHSQVIDQLHACSVFSLPSVTAGTGDQEGLGQVVLEAAAAERPVVATRHGGLTEAVSDGHTGLLVDERNVPQLAEALCLLLKDSSLAGAMGRAGRQMVLKNFDLYKQAKKVEDLYNNILVGSTMSS